MENVAGLIRSKYRPFGVHRTKKERSLLTSQIHHIDAQIS